MTDSLTNSLFLYSQPLQLLHRIEELLFERVARWQLEDVTPSRMGQPSRHRQEIPAHCRGKFKRRFVGGTKGDSVRGRIFRGYRASGGVEAGAGEALPRTGFGDDR